LSTILTYPTYTIDSWAGGVVDNFGAMWGVSSQDVSSAPGVKLRTSEKPNGPGAYRSGSNRAAKTINLSGWCKVANRAEARTARDRLLSLFPTGAQSLLTVDDGINPKQILVELASDIKIAFTGSPWFFQWQMSLYANNGRFYDLAGQSATTTLPASGSGLDWSTGGGLDWSTGGGLNWGSVSSNGTLSMTNIGSADTWPVFTLNGPIALPTITDSATGNVLQYGISLATGETLVIDNSPFTRSVLLNGTTDRFGVMTSAQWIKVAAFSTTTVVLGGAGSGTLSATWKNASW
jgi:tail protein